MLIVFSVTSKPPCSLATDGTKKRKDLPLPSPSRMFFGTRLKEDLWGYVTDKVYGLH
jgi:hypothetical protein